MPIRRSSRAGPRSYTEAVPFAEFTKDAILAADPAGATRDEVPYAGIQFVAIPELQGLDTTVGQNIAAVISGDSTVDEALAASQALAERTMERADYQGPRSTAAPPPGETPRRHGKGGARAVMPRATAGGSSRRRLGLEEIVPFRACEAGVKGQGMKLQHAADGGS